jgi:glycosyltransferase 2 family protein
MNARVWRNVLLSLVVSGGFLWLAFRNVPLADLSAALAKLDAWWLVLAVAISMVIMVFRAWRWQLELLPLEHVPFGRLWVVTAVAYMAINALPARLGEVVRPWLLSRRSGVSISNVVGNLVVEKTVDSIIILFYVLMGLLTISNLPDWAREGALVPAILALVLVTLVVLLWWRGEAFLDRWIVNRLPERFGATLKQILKAILAGMQILPSPLLLLSVFAVSLLLWFLPILSSYVMIRAFGFGLPFSAALLVFIFIGFGTALPNLPGMIGPFQYACQLALGVFHVSPADALAYGLVLNAVQFLSLIAQGIAALPLAGVSLAELRAAPRQAKRAGC